MFSPGSTGLAELFITPEQRAKLDGLTAVMSLLEGHADVVMDDVGPAHHPSVAQIRASSPSAARAVGQLDRLLRRLLGLEAKMRQYRDGAVFVRAVPTRSGSTASTPSGPRPDTLPSAAEIGRPGRRSRVDRACQPE